MPAHGDLHWTLDRQQCKLPHFRYPNCRRTNGTGQVNILRTLVRTGYPRGPRCVILSPQLPVERHGMRQFGMQDHNSLHLRPDALATMSHFGGTLYYEIIQ